MEVDYELYAEGEALLGWLNATLNLSTAAPIDGNELLRSLAGSIRGKLQAADAEIAHLKMTLSPGDAVGDIAVLNVVRNDQAGELSHKLQGEVASGELILNLRAEGDPEMLRSVVLEAIAECSKMNLGLSLTVEHLEHFRPGKPEPTYRYANA
jgi:hypothetical protein